MYADNATQKSDLQQHNPNKKEKIKIHFSTSPTTLTETNYPDCTCIGDFVSATRPDCT